LTKTMGFTSVRFVRTPHEYYTWDLTQRQEFLRAHSIHQLCKSIVLENTECTNSDCSDPLNSKFYCVIIQYSTRLSGHKLFKFVRSLKGNQIPLKNYHFQLAKSEDSERLTGFYHNAVSPVGMSVAIPIILSKRIIDLIPKYIYMGGGEVDLKLGLSVDEFIQRMNPLVGDVVFDSTSTNEGELED